MLTPNLRRRGMVMAAVALGTVGLLGAVLLPTWASSPDHAKPTTDFRVAGDGSLPTTAPRLRAPSAPLSSAERGYAIHLARTALPADARDVLGDPGGEVLAADLPPLGERTSARLVSVAVYDYSADRLHQLLLDLTHGSVLDERSVRGQLPPTATETTTALDLALKADPAPGFVRQYQKTTGNPLLEAEQVRAVAGVWRPGSSASDETATVCAQHRCLQLLIALPSGQYLGTGDFTVDLSARSVRSTRSQEPTDEH